MLDLILELMARLEMNYLLLVMDILKAEMKPHREQHGMGIFVTKFIPGYEAL